MTISSSRRPAFGVLLASAILVGCGSTNTTTSASAPPRTSTSAVSSTSHSSTANAASPDSSGKAPGTIDRGSLISVATAFEDAVDTATGHVNLPVANELSFDCLPATMKREDNILKTGARERPAEEARLHSPAMQAELAKASPTERKELEAIVLPSSPPEGKIAVEIGALHDRSVPIKEMPPDWTEVAVEYFAPGVPKALARHDFKFENGLWYHSACPYDQ